MINQNNVIDKYSGVEKAVNTFIAAIRDYNTKREEIKANGSYTAEAKENSLNALETEFKKQCETYNGTVKEKLDALLEAQKAAMRFDINDNTFLDRVNFINALEGKISEEIRADIVNQFIGNNQALIMLKSVFERYGLNAIDIDEHIIDVNAIEDKIKQLENLSWFMARDCNSAITQVYTASQHLTELANLLHIENTDTENEGV